MGEESRQEAAGREEELPRRVLADASLAARGARTRRDSPGHCSLNPSSHIVIEYGLWGPIQLLPCAPGPPGKMFGPQWDWSSQQPKGTRLGHTGTPCSASLAPPQLGWLLLTATCGETPMVFQRPGGQGVRGGVLEQRMGGRTHSPFYST